MGSGQRILGEKEEQRESTTTSSCDALRVNVCINPYHHLQVVSLPDLALYPLIMPSVIRNMRKIKPTKTVIDTQTFVS